MIQIVYIYIFISFFWFWRQLKTTLFWLYLWQLKEYHIGRFLDHFRTHKGKKLFLNWLFIFKIFLLFYALILGIYPKPFPWFSYAIWILILIIIYFFESAKFFLDFFKKQIKKPVFTKKALILILVNLIFLFLFLSIVFKNTEILYWFVFWLLLFDIFSPLVISAIVFFFQPLTVLLRNRIIKKAKEKREKFKNLLVIGITGSYGKTSTKEFLAEILSAKFRVLRTKGHQNSEIGISQCILDDLKEEHEIFVCEMGAYNKGGIKLLTDIARPKIGIVTGVNEQHLATFGSMENLLSAEGGKELIENLPEDGTAFFNGKNKHCVELYQKTKIKKYLYGKEAGVFGEENILGAISVAKELGMTDEEIVKAAEKIENKLSGIQQKKGINGLIILDASYSANPDGVLGHLDYLKNFSGKKIIIMPCLIELGSASKEIHKRIGKKIAETCNLAIITTKDRFKEIKEGINETGMKEDNILFMENPEKIFEKIKNFCYVGDVVLLEGRVPNQLINLLIV